MAKAFSNPAKKRAWDAFSQWVRVRDCIASTGLPFCGMCITCDTRFHIRYLDAGHCFAGRSNAGLFHEQLVNAQCRRCNQLLNGRLKKYRMIMEAKYSEEQVAKWHAECKKVRHNHDMDFDGIRDKYRKLTNVLLRPFGFNDYKDMLKE